MRKLKLQVQLSLDGFLAGPQGELDWMTHHWDDALKDSVRELMAPVDQLLMSHRMAGGFIPHWEGVVADSSAPDHEAGRFMVDTPKLLFSRQPQAQQWPRTTLLHGFDELPAQLARPGGDVLAYGGAGLVAGLAAGDYIDEYHLFVHPVALGQGLPLFTSLSQRRSLRLLHSRAFACGIVLLAYGRGG